MTDSLDDQLEKLILKHEAFDGQAIVVLSDLVADIKALIRQRETGLLKGFVEEILFDIRTSLGIYAGGIVSVEIAKKYRELEEFLLAELERRHDG